MLILNRTAYTKLKPYESHFKQAVWGNYVNCSLLRIKEIYEIVKTCNYNKSANFSCNSCRLHFLQDIGNAYFKYQEDTKETMKQVREGKINKNKEKEEGKDV